MKRTDLAWLAGILDGEGAVYIGRSFQKKRAIYSPDIRVEMVHEPTVDRVCSIYRQLGAACTKKSLPMRNRRHRPRHIVWMKGHESILRVCKAVRPFLVTKAQQAQLVAEFCRLRLKARFRKFEKRDSRGRLTTSYSTREPILYAKVRTLNKRGT